jgi:hypothetical protein
MLDSLPDALVMGEASAYAFTLQASVHLVRPSSIGEYLGAEMDAEAGEADDDFSVRVVRGKASSTAPAIWSVAVQAASSWIRSASPLRRPSSWKKPSCWLWD